MPITDPVPAVATQTQAALGSRFITPFSVQMDVPGFGMQDIPMVHPQTGRLYSSQTDAMNAWLAANPNLVAQQVPTPLMSYQPPPYQQQGSDHGGGGVDSR